MILCTLIYAASIGGFDRLFMLFVVGFACVLVFVVGFACYFNCGFGLGCGVCGCLAVGACCFATFCVDVGLLVLHFVCIWFVVQVVCFAVCCCLLLLAMLRRLVWGLLVFAVLVSGLFACCGLTAMVVW